MKKTRLFRFTLLALIAGLLICVSPGMAAAVNIPVVPHAFYGDLLINGSPAPIHTKVEAKGEGVNATCDNPLVTKEVGRYGESGPLGDKLFVQGTAIDEGTILTFYVNDMPTSQTFAWHSGEITKLDLVLTIGGGDGGDNGENGDSPGAGGGTASGGGGGTPEVYLKGLTSTGSLQLNAKGVTKYDCMLQSPDKDCKIIIKKGCKLLDKLGKPLTSFTHSHNVKQVPAAPEGTEIIGVHELGPGGATFEPGITIIFNINTGKIKGNLDENKIKVAYWDESKWQSIAGEIDTEAGNVAIVMTHFTIFAILLESEPVPPPVPEHSLITTPEPTSLPEAPDPEFTPLKTLEPAPQPEVTPDPPDTTQEVPVIPEVTSTTSKSILPLIFTAIVIVLGVSIFSLFVIKRRNR